jgi:hypothetical protein
MVAGSRLIRCGDSEGISIRLPEWPHDDAEVFCPGCGESLGTIGQLRELLVAALADESNSFSDNDN